MMPAVTLYSGILLCLQVAVGDRLGESTTWTFNESTLSCRQPVQRLSIPAGQHDAVLIDLVSSPPLKALLCSLDPILSVRSNTGEKPDTSHCPYRLNSRWMIYGNTEIGITVEWTSANCTESSDFSLNVTYYYWRCWETVEITGDVTLYSMNDFCGHVQMSSTAPILVILDRKEDNLVQSNDILFLIEIPSLHNDSYDNPDLRISVELRIIRLKSTEFPICRHITLTLFFTPYNKIYDMCNEYRQFTLTAKVKSLEITVMCLWENLPARPNITDTEEQQLSELRSVLAEFFLISMDLKFGLFSAREQLQNVNNLLPFQFRQNCLDVNIHSPPGATLSFSTWFYFIDIRVPPGQQVEVHWNPITNPKFAFAFWATATLYNSNELGYTVGNTFLMLLGNQSAGYARSFSNTMVMELSMQRLLSYSELQTTKGQPALVIFAFNAIPMLNMCDEDSRDQWNITVSNVLLKNAELFWARRSSPQQGDLFNCHLTFRTQTDNSIFMAKIWPLTINSCAYGRLFIFIGTIRYVSMCGTDKGNYEESYLHDYLEVLPAYFTIHYAFIESDVISVILYDVYNPGSHWASKSLGITGELITTCPRAGPLNGISNGTSSSCAWNVLPLNEVSSVLNASMKLCHCLSLSSRMLETNYLFCLSVPSLSNGSVWQSAMLINDKDTIEMSYIGSDFVLEHFVFFFPPPALNTAWMDPGVEGSAQSIIRIQPIPSITQSYYLVSLEVKHYQSVVGVNQSKHDSLITVRDEGVDLLFQTSDYTHLSIRLRTFDFNVEISAGPLAPCLIAEFFSIKYPVDALNASHDSCPSNFSLLGNNCFRTDIVPAPMSWEEAAESCRRWNASLITISDRNELQQMLWLTKSAFEALSKKRLLLVHVGLRRENGSMSWVDPSIPVSLTDWFRPDDYGNNDVYLKRLRDGMWSSPDTPQPTEFNGDCVAMIPRRPSGPSNWLMVPCSLQLNSTLFTLLEMCMIRKPIPPSPLSPWSDSYCPAGWIFAKSVCYKMISDSNMTTDGAERACTRDDAEVAQFNVTVEKDLFNAWMWTPDDGSRWMNNTETQRLTPFRLLSHAPASDLVPVWNGTAGGVLCQQQVRDSVVFLQHRFEVACNDKSVINYYRWCDGTADCPDGEDEHNCNAVLRKQKPIANVHDTVGKAAWSEADWEAFSSWMEPLGRSDDSGSPKDRTQVDKVCDKEGVRCHADNNQTDGCIPQTHACIYGVTGCSSLVHLSSCEHFSCPRMFKCPLSYCVSLRRVCDGSNDCPHGDDELLCDHVCRGLYRCGTRCLPLTAVCDGVKQCEDGDDELYCPRPPPDYCPDMCHCHDTRILCPRLNGTLRVPEVTETLDAASAGLTSLESLDLSVASRLVTLNLSHNSIRLLRSNQFVPLSTLRSLDLSHNLIKSLRRGWFEGLFSLESIQIKGNPIADIDPFSFSPLSNVSFLDLRALSVSTIRGYAFSGMQNLSELHLEDNQIVTLEWAAFFGIPALRRLYLYGNAIASMSASLFDPHTKLDVLISDRKELCCAVTVRECLPAMSVPGLCTRLIPYVWMRLVFYFSALGSVAINVAVVLWIVVKGRVLPLSFHLLLFHVNELAIGVHMLHILIVDSSDSVPFFVRIREWPVSVQCNASGMLAMAALLGSSGCLIHMASAYLCKRQLLAMTGAVVLLQLSVVPAYFLLGRGIFARVPSCILGLVLDGEGWWLSVLWDILISIASVPLTILAVKHWRKEYRELKTFRVRQVDRKANSLANLRMLALLVWTALANATLAVVWLSEAFGVTGVESDGLIWSSLVALPLRTLAVALFYAASLLVSRRYLKL